MTTVAELIAHLQTLPQNIPVVVGDNFVGEDDVELFKLLKIDNISMEDVYVSDEQGEGMSIVLR